MAGLAVHVDIEASLAALDAGEHDQGDMLKFPQDLDRYAAVIEATQPEVIVETGTRRGASARWFRDRGPDVITVDNFPDQFEGDETRITRIVGDSEDELVAGMVARMVADRRCMVSLDTTHDAAHVLREIDLYGPLVTSGCYLVVEDAILGYADESMLLRHALGGMVGSPLDAIRKRLAGKRGWVRDVDLEAMHPISHNSAGWWRRV